MVRPKKTTGRKRKTPSPGFHEHFTPPTTQERKEALGSFPGAPHAVKSRRSMLLGGNRQERPSLEQSTVLDALSDLDNSSLYIPAGRSVTAQAVKDPVDKLDWLAQVPEESQTFDEYIQFLTSRSGRLRPIANAAGQDIVLLPIVGGNGWTGPLLDELVAYTRAFFDRNVQILEPAVIRASSKPAASTPGAFASAVKGKFSIKFPTSTGGKVVGRNDPQSGHTQLQVASVLDQLFEFRERFYQDSFCVVGITMQDLYDGPSDLFCAGMAFGGSKIAVFSFCRYHPYIKMHPMYWYDYGYTTKWSSYSYYDENQNPTGLHSTAPDWDEMAPRARQEMWCRSAKLLTHEIGHLYGVDHCIHNRCVMNGTGHLVEDFAAPPHLCGVCLRKLQWRLGFRIAGRYRLLADAFSCMGMEVEKKWALRQADSCDAAAFNAS